MEILFRRQNAFLMIILFAEGKDLIIDIPVDPQGISDVYIDDIISLCVDIEGTDHVERLKQCSLLAINIASRDVHEEEPIPRAEMAEKGSF